MFASPSFASFVARATAALLHAGQEARRIGIETGTGIVAGRGDKPVRISAKQLLREAQ